MFRSDFSRTPRNHQQHQQENEEEDALVLRMEEMIGEEEEENPDELGEEEDEEEERVSFADSERFFDDDEVQISSQQSSESGSLGHNCWRGWGENSLVAEEGGQRGIYEYLISRDGAQGQQHYNGETGTLTTTTNQREAKVSCPPSLAELAARKVASALSFELIESIYAGLPREQRTHQHPAQNTLLPEHLVLPILRHCFPDSIDNIRLYSCLTHCGDRLFALGEQLFLSGAVSELFQIGYHLSAVVNDCQRFAAIGSSRNFDSSKINSGGRAGAGGVAGAQFDVCIRVDRCRIVSCSCSCSNSSYWCQHVVAACLKRIRHPDSVQYRTAIWDSITSLKDRDLKKLAQYLINELPREYIPVAQKLIDALRDSGSEINRTQGAPDPTAGLAQSHPAVWCLDKQALREEVRKMLWDFLRKSASLSVVCEFQSLLISPPALAHEWNTLQRTYCARQPEAIWNLLGMVRVMLQRRDANAPTLLRIITEQCLTLDTVLLRWYQVSLARSGHWDQVGNPHGQRGNAQQNQSRQLNIYLLCQELVVLWRMVALNPRLSPAERTRLRMLLQFYHRTAACRIHAILGKSSAGGTENGTSTSGHLIDARGQRLCQQNAPFSRQHFAAFFPALRACQQIDWTNPVLLDGLVDGTSLGLDIQQHRGRHRSSVAGPSSDSPFSNLPFLGGELMQLPDLLETDMGGRLSGLELNNSDDVVVLPQSQKAAARRRKKKRKERQQQQRDKQRNLQEKEQRQQKQERWGRESGSEKDSEQSATGQDAGTSGSVGTSQKKQRREVFEDELDTLFAEAYASELPDDDLPDAFRVHFVLCEALFCHGYFSEALHIGERLAREMLANPPNLLPGHHSNPGADNDDEAKLATLESPGSTIPSGSGTAVDSGPEYGTATRAKRCLTTSALVLAVRRRSVDPSGHHKLPRWVACSFAHLIDSTKLSRKSLMRTIFLVKLLLMGNDFLRDKNRKSQSKPSGCDTGSALPLPVQLRLLALDLAVATLDNPRGAAATKLADMEINHLETELFTQLHRIELCPEGLEKLRAVAINGGHSARVAENREGSAIPPFRLAHYVANALAINRNGIGAQLGGTQNGQPLVPCQPSVLRTQSDEDLGLQFALEVLKRDVCISELDHPLLCESIRRQRKDLQMSLLTRKRDAPERLARVLETVLDPSVHRFYEDHCRSNVDFFLPCAPGASASCPSASSVSALPHHRPLHLVSSDSSPSSSPPFPFPINQKINNSFVSFSRSDSGGGASDSTNRSSSLEQQHTLTMTTNKGRPIEGNKYPHHRQHSSPTSHQTSESHAHHLFEFAKSLLQEAGGNPLPHPIFNSAVVLATTGANGDNGGNAATGGGAGPHRALHISSLLIALYALGLNNACSPSWSTRTYSTHVSWIQAQVLDIGRQALEIIRRTWRNHLTATETAALADKASQSSDPAMGEEAALLALSVLPEANSLLPAESQKALNQCKERGPKLLEEACMAVEKAAERGGVYPEVLFRVAHHWYDDLYITHLENVNAQNQHQPQSLHIVQQQQQQQFLHYSGRQPQQPGVVRLVQPHQYQAPHFPATGYLSSSNPASSSSVVYSPSLPPPPPPQLPQFLGTVVVQHHNSKQYNQQQPLAPLFPHPTLPPPPPPSHYLPVQQVQVGPEPSAMPPPQLHPVPATSTTPLYSLQQQSLQPVSIGPASPCPLMQMPLTMPPPAQYAAFGVAHRNLPTPAQHFVNHQQHNNYLGNCSNSNRGTSKQQLRADGRAMQLLRNAHRCGIAAMNGLRSTESASSKFAKNPPSSDEICWLLEVSMEIGDPDYVRLFLERAFACVYSPFVLLQLLKGAFRFFQHLPGASRMSASGDACSLALQLANSAQAKACVQHAKGAMALHPVAGPVEELLMHAVLCCFNAASHKLSYPNFSSSDQDYVCELALAARDIFRHIPPYHHHDQQQHGRRKYMDLLLEHMQEQKAFKSRKNGGMAVVKSTLAQRHEY